MPSNKNLLRVASGSAGLADPSAIANPAVGLYLDIYELKYIL